MKENSALERALEKLRASQPEELERIKKERIKAQKEEEKKLILEKKLENAKAGKKTKGKRGPYLTKAIRATMSEEEIKDYKARQRHISHLKERKKWIEKHISEITLASKEKRFEVSFCLSFLTGSKRFKTLEEAQEFKRETLEGYGKKYRRKR